MRLAIMLLAVGIGSSCYAARDRAGCVWEGRYYANGERISEVRCMDGPSGGHSGTSWCEDGLVVGTIIDWSGPEADGGPDDAGPRCEVIR